MKSTADNPTAYIASLPADRAAVISRLHETITSRLRGGFETGTACGMISYHVPIKRFPAGYHCKPGEPVPFMNLASQKNYVAVYHMGLYKDGLAEWFNREYKALCGRKPDMGKCCIRFKNLSAIPYELIGELAAKVNLDEWLEYYESQTGKNR